MKFCPGQNRLAARIVQFESSCQPFVQDKNEETPLTIAAVERDVGLSKDVLRVWERRYGFPVPERDANGERLYPANRSSGCG